MPQNDYEIITDGTVKIFAKDANVVTATPIDTVTPSNTDDLRYMFEDLPEGEYTYSASAPGKGTVVGTFKLPWDGRAEDEFRKFIPDIFLTPAVAELTINLVDKDDDPDGIRSYIDTDVRVKALGIDGEFVINGDWVVPNAPTTPNGLIEIIPDNPVLLQNLRVFRQISDTYNYHSIKVMPPFKVLINVLNITGGANMNSISRVYLKHIGGEWIELLNPSGGSFIAEYTSDGEYQVRVKTFGFAERILNYSWVYPTSGVISVNIPLSQNNQETFNWHLINNPSNTQIKIKNLTTDTELLYPNATTGDYSELQGVFGAATDDLEIEIAYGGSLAVNDLEVIASSTYGPIAHITLGARYRRDEFVTLHASKFGLFNRDVDFEIRVIPTLRGL